MIYPFRQRRYPNRTVGFNAGTLPGFDLLFAYRRHGLILILPIRRIVHPDSSDIAFRRIDLPLCKTVGSRIFTSVHLIRRHRIHQRHMLRIGRIVVVINDIVDLTVFIRNLLLRIFTERTCASPDNGNAFRRIVFIFKTGIPQVVRRGNIHFIRQIRRPCRNVLLRISLCSDICRIINGIHRLADHNVRYHPF